jgi:Endoribonuclease L-PSP
MAATREVVTGPSVPTGIGPYSAAVRAGDLLFVSGQPGVDPETAQPVGSTFGEQARKRFATLMLYSARAAAARSSWSTPLCSSPTLTILPSSTSCTGSSLRQTHLRG